MQNTHFHNFDTFQLDNETKKCVFQCHFHDDDADSLAIAEIAVRIIK